MSFIYLIRNKFNGKGCVGQTSLPSVEDRWRGHFKCSKSASTLLVHQAIRKYGYDNFTVTMLEECCSNMISEREIYWINELCTFVGDCPDKGYNMTQGGEFGIKGYHHTYETKRAISEALVGEKNPFFGRKHKPEAIQKMRAKLLGKKASDG